MLIGKKGAKIILGFVPQSDFILAVVPQSENNLGINPQNGLGINPQTGLGINPQTGLGINPQTGLGINTHVNLAVIPVPRFQKSQVNLNERKCCRDSLETKKMAKK